MCSLCFIIRSVLMSDQATTTSISVCPVLIIQIAWAALMFIGFPHLTKLLSATTFPWLLSNIIDTTTGNQPEPLKRYWVTERCGVRIGVIGLVEQCVLIRTDGTIH